MFDLGLGSLEASGYLSISGGIPVTAKARPHNASCRNWSYGTSSDIGALQETSCHLSSALSELYCSPTTGVELNEEQPLVLDFAAIAMLGFDLTKDPPNGCPQSFLLVKAEGGCGDFSGHVKTLVCNGRTCFDENHAGCDRCELFVADRGVSIPQQNIQ
jgi:hypothetical protein